MRQSIRNIKGYRAAGQRKEPVNNLLRGIAESRGLGCVSIGPYYLPEKIKPSQFTMSVAYPESDAQLRVMSWVSRNTGVPSYGVKLPNTYGEPVQLTNLVTREPIVLTLSAFQDKVMESIAPYLSSWERWDPESRTDNTNPEPLNGETSKLLDQRKDWLDYMIRTIDSDNLTKLDMDNVIFDPKTYRPLLFVEAKATGGNNQFRITSDLASKCGAPGGLVHYDADTDFWGYRGFGLGWRDGVTDSTVSTFINRILD